MALTNTSVLTLDNFRSEDNGMYQCCAMSGGVTREWQYSVP